MVNPPPFSLPRAIPPWLFGLRSAHGAPRRTRGCAPLPSICRFEVLSTSLFQERGHGDLPDESEWRPLLRIWILGLQRDLFTSSRLVWLYQLQTCEINVSECDFTLTYISHKASSYCYSSGRTTNWTRLQFSLELRRMGTRINSDATTYVTVLTIISQG